MTSGPDFSQQERRCDFTSTHGRKISQREHKLVGELYGRRNNLSLLALLFISVRLVSGASSPQRDLSFFWWLPHGSYIPWEMFKVPLASLVEPEQPSGSRRNPADPTTTKQQYKEVEFIYDI